MTGRGRGARGEGDSCGGIWVYVCWIKVGVKHFHYLLRSASRAAFVLSIAVSRGGLSLYKLEYTYTVRSLFAVGLRTVSVPTHIAVRVGSSELTGGGAHERARARAGKTTVRVYGFLDTQRRSKRGRGSKALTI